ncbi:hypothetical protein ACFQ5N_00830 [Lutibacter holmesii]|uniref:Uncharacterized protein n=1 Tax=Lutibacter holmesii TaxID=1137985 RepID=A0ABW3WKV4_9FLAO
MLVGKENKINSKIVDEISYVFPIVFKNYEDVMRDIDTMYQPRILIVNLMDVGQVEEEVISKLKEKFPELKCIALHCYQSLEMIQKTLDKGYDDYISIFDLSEGFLKLLIEQKVV